MPRGNCSTGHGRPKGLNVHSRSRLLRDSPKESHANLPARPSMSVRSSQPPFDDTGEIDRIVEGANTAYRILQLEVRDARFLNVDR